MTRAVADGRPVWRVRLRYLDGRRLSMVERLTTSKWVETTLPNEGAVQPVSSLPLTGGWTVMMHVHAATAPDAVTAAGDLVDIVVGDTVRVLGQLVDTRVAPVKTWP